MDAHAGEKVHVHCAANYRVTAFYSVYALERGLWTEDEAATGSCAYVWEPERVPRLAAFIADEQARIRG